MIKWGWKILCTNDSTPIKIDHRELIKKMTNLSKNIKKTFTCLNLINLAQKYTGADPS